MDVMASSLLPSGATERHYYTRPAVRARAGRGRDSQVETMMKKRSRKSGRGKAAAEETVAKKRPRKRRSGKKTAAEKTVGKKDGDVSQKDDDMT
ncbi:MAG: hypothetical protein LBP95_04165 [Deltaproteobacteria bacterium]|jgi:hypothetical protein|nr:hypothetical protein [Deltaproteobacteria bacterium]